MLGRQGLTLLVTLATLVATVWLYIVMPKGFLPSQDTGLIFAVSEAGTEVSFAQMQRLQAQVEAAIKKDPDVTGFVSILGVSRINPTPNAGHLAITLRPRDERRSSVDEIVRRLKQAVAPIPGMTLYFQPVQDIQISTRASRAQYQYTLVGTDSGDVIEWADKLTKELRKDRRLLDVASEAQEGGLRMQVEVDREKAGRLGVSMQAINDTLNDAFGQRQISTIYSQANQYRVILEAHPRYQQRSQARCRSFTSPAPTPRPAPRRWSPTPRPARPTPTLRRRPTRSPAATRFRCRHSHASSTSRRRWRSRTRSSFRRSPSASICRPGSALSDAVAAVSSAKRTIEMPSSVTGSYSGDSAEFDKSLAGQPWLILAAAITIYIVLGVLYESLIHPITILSTLPSAGVGALLALMLLGLRSVGHRAHRHRAADGHRQEERDHDDRLRA